MFNKVTKTFQYGQHTVTLETGEIARQASGAVMVSVEDTVVLATVVARKDAKPGQDFFPQRGWARFDIWFSLDRINGVH